MEAINTGNDTRNIYLISIYLIRPAPGPRLPVPEAMDTRNGTATRTGKRNIYNCTLYLPYSETGQWLIYL
eukprot:SAG31_NODE_162_length_21892_cov_343.171936_5_plen_70_part_00